jgi:hypothetical protein
MYKEQPGHLKHEKKHTEWKKESKLTEAKNPPKWESPRPPIDSKPPLIQSDIEGTTDYLVIGNSTFYISYSRSIPDLSESEFEALSQDIACKGILVPVIVDENNHIIDGEHRLRVAQKLNLKDIPIQVRPGLTDQDKWQLAQDLNLHRRHLTMDKIKEIYETNKKLLPQMAVQLRKEGKSYRQIGEQLDVSHQQAKNLVEMESTVNPLTVDLPEKIQGRDGRLRPAKNPVIQVQNTKELQRAVEACKTAGTDNLPQKSIELKRLERIARESTRQKLRAQEVRDFQEGQTLLLQGDFNSRGKDIADNSAHLIMTDLPYEKSALPLWEQLSLFASAKLKDGGILISYSGCLYLPQVMEGLGKHLTYLWTAAIYHSGATKNVYPVGLTQGWKPLLIYYKPPLNIYWPMTHDIYSGGEEKSNHEWQQATSEALYFIKTFCPKNGTMIDPCMGSGTSIIAGLQSGLGLNCIGIELDKATFIEAQRRIQESTNP